MEGGDTNVCAEVLSMDWRPMVECVGGRTTWSEERDVMEMLVQLYEIKVLRHPFYFTP